MAEKEQQEPTGVGEIEFRVSGMACRACEQALSMVLGQHEAVRSVVADAKSGKVRVVLLRDVDVSELKERIRSAGYEVD
ncbi:MAG TPA: heavy-metal-associated domain-containing protein [Planctomycetaceae bacterium]|nr:heavy-metal-associated domain-containing protein [Planctomycetaceae bacterium]HIQ22283.1 heavy-metal-associated domain-containing protein [Planctomycetota bacterium]